MKLFVTGSTGHTGRYFIKKLDGEGYASDIVCLVRKTSDTALLDNSRLKITKAFGDLNDVDFMLENMRGCEMVLHIAGIYQSRNVMSAAKKAGIKNIILVHTTGMFSRFKKASSDYIDIEESILSDKQDTNIVILRPTMIYGSAMDRNMFKLVEYLDTHKFFPIFGRGKNLMQPVHADDLAQAYFGVIQNWETTKNKNYNLAGKYPIEYIELIRTVEDYLGKKVHNVKIPIWISLFAAVIYNKVSKGALISTEQVQRMMEDKAFSYEDAVRDFDYNPRSFADGVRGEVEEYKRKKANET